MVRYTDLCPQATDTGLHGHREAGVERESSLQEGRGPRQHQRGEGSEESGEAERRPARPWGAWILPSLVTSSGLTSGRCWEGWLALQSPFSVPKV